MAEVKLENVSKIYDGDIRAVKSVDLDIANNEFMVLVGPSGCGKSTTLRMIAGLEEISEGTCKIGERVVNNLPPKNRDIAMVFQNYALYPHMSVYDNMAFGLKLRKLPKAEINERVRKATKILGLGAYLERKPKALSGGQRQRVAMGRAIVREPAVFLFDEPLSNLDAKMRVEMRKEILQLHRRIRTTMIYVTHDQVEAMTLGDRITVMNDGIVEQVGTPREVFDTPASLFVAGFIGTPPMNLLEGKLTENRSSFVFDSGTVRVTLPAEMSSAISGYAGKQVVMGIRPKSLVPTEDAPPEARANAFTARIELTEMLGEELLVHMEAGPHKIVASASPHDTRYHAEQAGICPLLERAHIFDKETGRNLTMTRAATSRASSE